MTRLKINFWNNPRAKPFWRALTRVYALAVQAIRSGYQSGLIHENAYHVQTGVEDGSRIVVGVNQYQSPAPNIEKLQTISQEEIDGHLKRLSDVRKQRDNRRVSDALKELTLASQTGENTFPLILKCVEAYSTLGEISDALRLSFGEQGDFGAF